MNLIQLLIWIFRISGLLLLGVGALLALVVIRGWVSYPLSFAATPEEALDRTYYLVSFSKGWYVLALALVLVGCGFLYCGRPLAQRIMGTERKLHASYEGSEGKR